MTELNAGGVAILGFNGDGSNDFSFVLMSDVAAGTVIYFTDAGTNSGSNQFLDNGIDGVKAWTASVDYAAGTVVNSVTGPHVSEFADPFILGDFSLFGALNLAGKVAGGDQLFAFQATGTELAPGVIEADSVNFLFAIQSNSTNFQGSTSDGGASDGDPSDPNQSGVPLGLTEGDTALALGAGSDPEDPTGNLVYSGPTTGTRAGLLAAIADESNWTKSDTPQTQLTAAFTITDAAANADPVVSIPAVIPTTAHHFETDEDTVVNVTGVSVSDAEGDAVTVILTADGTITVANSGTVTDNGSNSVTVTGSVAEVNTALAGLTYLPSFEFSGDEVITIKAFDDLLSFTQERITVQVAPVDDPTAIGDIPSSLDFTSAELLSGAQLLFDDVGGDVPVATVTDPDTILFGGGRIEVTYSSGGVPSDQLSVRDVSFIVPGTTTRLGIEIVEPVQPAPPAAQLPTEIFSTVSLGPDSEGRAKIGEIRVGNDGSNGSSLIIDLVGTVHAAAIEDILLALEFGSSMPGAGTRTIDITVYDAADNASNTTSTDVSITVANAVPVLDGLESVVELDVATLGTPQHFIDTALDVIDPDSNDFDGGSVRIEFTSLRDGEGDFLVGDEFFGIADLGDITVVGTAVFHLGNQIGTITGDGTGGTPFVVDLAGANATPDAVEALIEALTYTNIAGTPETTRGVDLTVSDGDGGTTDPQSFRIEAITPPPPPPPADFTITYTENDPIQVIDDEAQISVPTFTPDDFVNLTVTITGGGVTTEDVLTAASGVSGVTPVYSGSTITSVSVSVGGVSALFYASGGSNGTPLVLTPSFAGFFGFFGETVEHVQLLSQALGYVNTSDDPTDANRTVTVDLDTGAGAVTLNTFTVDVDPVADAPVISDLATQVDLLFANVSGASAFIDTSITVTDADTTNFNGSKLTVEHTGAAPAGDQLTVEDLGAVTVSGSTISHTGTAVATITGGSNGSALVIDFTGATVSAAMVDEIMEAISFETTDLDPALSRTLRYTLENAEAGTAGSAPVTINITGPGANQAPEIATPDPIFGVNRSDLLDTPQAVFATVSVTDSDSADFDGGSLTISYVESRVRTENQLSILDAPPFILAGDQLFHALGNLGTIVSDGSDGSPLQIDFTSALVTPSIVNQILDAVRYQNTSLTPGASIDLTVELSDGDGETSLPAQVRVDIVFDAVAVDDTVAGVEDTQTVISFAELLANDPDADPDATVTGVSGAVNGTVAIFGDTVRFDPTAEFSGDASFTYEISNGQSTDQATVTVSVAAVNDAPTAVTLTQTLSDIDENSDTSSRIQVATIAVTDDALGVNDLGLSGADAAEFEIDGGVLYLRAGTTLNFEDQDQFDVTVTVDDTSVGATPDAQASLSVAVNDVNEAPTAVTLTQTLSDIDENSDTSSRIQVATIAVTDDALGVNDLGLSGADAAEFEIDGGVLYLRAGTTLNFEDQDQFDVTVTVDDTSVGATPDAQASLSVAVNDVNEAPTAVTLTQTLSDIDENSDTSSRIQVATIAVTDDALGVNDLGLSGADAAEFEIDGGVLYLRAGTTLNFEDQDQFDVTVTVDDTSVGATPDAQASLSVAVNDVNEAPTAVTLTQTLSDIDENSDTSSRIQVATIAVTDDALGVNDLGLSGADAAEFEIDGGVLYLRAGTTLNFEDQDQFDVTVTVDDTSVGATPDAQASLSVAVNDVNEAPTAVTLTQTLSDIDENSDTSSRIQVATIAVTDDALGVNDLGLSGADAAEFEIDGGVLYLRAGTTLNFEDQDQFDVTVTVDDTSVGATPDAQASLSVAVNDVNEAPTAVTLTQTLSDIDENSDTSSRIQVATIAVTDDALGVNDLGLSGADAAEFEIDGGVLYLRAGTTLNFEDQDQFDVTVTVDDTSVGATPDAQASLSVAVNDVNEAPTAVTLTQTLSDIDENSDTSSRIQVATIAVTDDALGVNDLGLSGADAAEFEIDGGVLYLRAGTTLNFEDQDQFDVTVTVDDTSVGATPDAQASLSVAVNDVNEAPTAVTLTQTLSDIDENSDTSSRIQVATIAVTDDALGVNDLGLSGADAAEFEIDGGVLYLRAGTTLNFEDQDQFDVTVTVDDTSVGATPDAQASLSVAVNDVNEAPTAVTLTQTLSDIDENSDTSSRIQVATIAVTDDALGVNDLGLSGADAAEFEIDGGVLYLRAGTTLNFEDQDQFDVTVTVDDTSVGATPDAQASLSVAVNDVNEAPTAVTLTQTLSDIDENSDTSSRIQVATIAVTDDALGVNDLGLSGADAAEFEIDGGVLYLRAGTTLNFEDQDQFDVTVTVDDTSVGATPDAQASLSVAVNDVNEAPTAVTLTQTLSDIDENSDTSSRIQVATIAVTDDALGVNDLGLSGADAAEFEIDGGVLYLRAGTTLNFEDQDQFDVTVTVDDTSVGATPDAQASLSVAVNDVNEAPTAVTLTQTLSDIDENSDTSSRIQVATIAVTDDALGVNDLGLSGADAAEFEIDGGVLYLRAGTTLNFEDQDQFDVTVTVDDTSVGATPDAQASLSVAVNDVNEAPTAVTLTQTLSDIDENSDTSSRIQVATIAVTDDALGVNDLGLSGADAAEFEIDGGVLYLRAGTTLNFEDQDQFDVTVTVDDTSVGATPDAQASLSVAVNDVNEAPTAVTLTQTLSDIDENSDTSSRIQVATIAVTDDALGVNDLGLSGADAAEFEIDGGVLYLRAGTTLNFEDQDQFDVTVTVDDTSVGATPDAQASLSVAVNDVNEAPTAVTLTQTLSDIDENSDTSSRIQVATIAVTDDALGVNDLGLSGADAAEFEIDGGVLYLRAGTTLNFEDQDQFDVTVTVDDTSVGATPDAQASLSVAVNDVNEAPTAVTLTQTLSDIDENSDTSSRIQVATIAVTDDALGVNDLGLSGADAAEFEIDGGVLYLRAGTTLNFEDQDQFDVTVTVDDTSVGATPDAQASLSVAVNDVNEAPTAVTLTQTLSDIDENSDTSSRIQVATIAVTDDALGVNDLGLSGADAAEFEIDGGVLYLRAGTTLNFEDQDQFDVTVTVDDTSVGATPDAQASLSVAVNDVNEAPTAVTLTQTLSDIDENSDTSSRIQVATIAVTDDALGVNDLGLSGADAAEFEIDGGVLYLRAGTTLNFEDQDQFDVTVTVDDTSVGATPDAQASLSVAVNDVNEAPTAVTLTQTLSDIDENSDTSSRIQVATIAVTDDALGVNDLGLSGADAAEFEIDGGVLYLRAGTTLNFEDQDQFDVTVTVDDTSVGATPDAQASLSVAVNDVNEAPTAVTLTQTLSDIDENSDTSSRIQVATIAVTDDALGVNDLGLSGADAAEFEIDGGVLYLRAGTTLNFEDQDQFDVTVTVDDTSVGATPDAQASLSVAVNDVNEAPSGSVALTGVEAETFVLTADVSAIEDPEGILAGSFVYTWFRDLVAIAGATEQTYTLTEADVGSEISVSVTFTDLLGKSETGGTAETDVITATNQLLTGTPDMDTLTGGGGDDTVLGLGENDRLSGSGGNDSIEGGSGNDLIDGDTGRDTLEGGDGADILRGGEGNDELDGGTGSDRINAGAGDDFVFSFSSSSADSDLIFAGSGDDTVVSGNGQDTVFGMEGDDLISGGAGSDFLVGQDGDDVLSGGANQDILFGGDGDDFLNGGFAHDLLHGGSGADRFFRFDGLGHGTDWIADYDASEGDLLVFAGPAATTSDFTVFFTNAVDDLGILSGDDAIEEAFVLYNPTGQRIFTLVDGASQTELILRVATTGEEFDLLA
ncbi:tandem-95 repeat protein [Aliisedimentitalea scapharcae]|uniref:Tandem-95 repeat protein n=1 Tax=Aliisedimentitalea scapharcae TaxID=1524259 RepID=A0ABZ2XX37_9RHOB